MTLTRSVLERRLECFTPAGEKTYYFNPVQRKLFSQGTNIVEMAVTLVARWQVKKEKG